MTRIALTVLLLFVPTCLWADVLVLKNGRKIEGKVTKRGGDYIVVMNSGISAKFPASKVRNVIAKASPREVIEKKWKALAGGDYHSRMDLAGEARREGLTEIEKKLYREVLKIKPNYYRARVRLGYVRYKGRWMLRKDFLKKMKLARHKGNWIDKDKKADLKRQAADEKRIAGITGEVRKILYLGTSRKRKNLASELKKNHSKPLLKKAYTSMLDNSGSKVRIFAAQQLATLKEKKALPHLVKAMVHDNSGKVRRAAYYSVKSLGGPPKNTHNMIIQAVNHKQRPTRFAAMGAVRAFRIGAARPALVARASTLKGMGLTRQHSSFSTQRAYIKGWDLGSAGVANSQGQEVPDPEIATFFEGVMVEVSIVKIEYILVRRVLSKLPR